MYTRINQNNLFLSNTMLNINLTVWYFNKVKAMKLNVLDTYTYRKIEDKQNNSYTPCRYTMIAVQITYL